MCSSDLEVRRRPVYFGGDGGWVDAPVYRRDALPSGFEAEGPLVIEEYGSTTVVGAGDCCRIGDLGEIRISIGD